MPILRRTLPYLLLALLFASCHISAKMDRFVAEQYNNQFPKITGKKNQEIVVTTNLPVDKQQAISNTRKNTSQMVPLIVYWSYDYRRTCSLNYQVPVNLITNSIYSTTNRKLEEKIKGKKLELQIEQVPSKFAIVDKVHIALIVYWHKFYREPDFSDLVVSYKLLDNGAEIKSGRLSIENKLQNVGVRFAQSVQSSCQESISEYNEELKSMTKRLMEELGEVL